MVPGRRGGVDTVLRLITRGRRLVMCCPTWARMHAMDVNVTEEAYSIDKRRAQRPRFLDGLLEYTDGTNIGVMFYVMTEGVTEVMNAACVPGIIGTRETKHLGLMHRVTIMGLKMASDVSQVELLRRNTAEGPVGLIFVSVAACGNQSAVSVADRLLLI